ncbi:uncharacterized protein LOC131946514 [Physella acuta]|uniref:uncharacterized protein LOC131946514 n=1 Tax=Physella acuta TaxID=109671 RepID=UPI0027DBB800|nr:uncharacterized protein LOC131946514 [Physella acuta]
MLFLFFLIDVVHCGPVIKPDEKPIDLNIRWAGLFLAVHKYYEVDKRKGNEQSWGFEDRVFFKHFPLPRLKKLHPALAEACDKGLDGCVYEIARRAKGSYSLRDVLGINLPEDATIWYPFKTALELFQFRTTGSYYMCWYTLQKVQGLKNYMRGQPCLTDLEKSRESQGMDYKVNDFRKDSDDAPFLCAEIQFCPDPCYGRKTEGSVVSDHSMKTDKGNPCRNLKNPTCSWASEKNQDFDGLQKNLFNITCHCEKSGFEWNSRFELCVDIDECRDGTTRCHNGRVCQNTPGGFECTCRKGYKFDPHANTCIEHIPLPAHSYRHTGRVKAIRQNMERKSGFTSDCISDMERKSGFTSNCISDMERKSGFTSDCISDMERKSGFTSDCISDMER